MNLDDTKFLRCPRCGGGLSFSGHCRGDLVTRGELACEVCATAWPVRDGVARLVDEARVAPWDAFTRVIYDWSAPVHDAAVTYVLPLLQLSTEASLRNQYMARLELESLRPHADGSPVRILEVGVGAGANIPLMRARLPRGLPVELWAVDLSDGMLDRCRNLHTAFEGQRIRYAIADAHALPFEDGMFDRVFHVGGIAGYGDPGKALSEMARVATPDSPIVVVDEQLAGSVSLWEKAWFSVFALVAPKHGAPVHDLPAGAYDLLPEQISSFYYSLRFRMPRAA